MHRLRHLRRSKENVLPREEKSVTMHSEMDKLVVHLCLMQDVHRERQWKSVTILSDSDWVSRGLTLK